MTSCDLSFTIFSGLFYCATKLTKSVVNNGTFIRGYDDYWLRTTMISASTERASKRDWIWFSRSLQQQRSRLIIARHSVAQTEGKTFFCWLSVQLRKWKWKGESFYRRLLFGLPLERQTDDEAHQVRTECLYRSKLVFKDTTNYPRYWTRSTVHHPYNLDPMS